MVETLWINVDKVEKLLIVEKKAVLNTSFPLFHNYVWEDIVKPLYIGFIYQQVFHILCGNKNVILVVR